MPLTRSLRSLCCLTLCCLTLSLDLVVISLGPAVLRVFAFPTLPSIEHVASRGLSRILNQSRTNEVAGLSEERTEAKSQQYVTVIVFGPLQHAARPYAPICPPVARQHARFGIEPSVSTISVGVRTCQDAWRCRLMRFGVQGGLSRGAEGVRDRLCSGKWAEQHSRWPPHLQGSRTRGRSWGIMLG